MSDHSRRRRSGDEPETAQAALMGAAIELMHVLGEASTALARLPAVRAGDVANAGMTFTMLRGVEPLPVRVERHVFQERIAALAGTRCDLSDRARHNLAQASEYLTGLA